MKQRWMLGCLLISAIVLELCVASILRHKLNVIPKEDEGYREHIRKIRQESPKCPALLINNAAACPASDVNAECPVVCDDYYELEGESKITCEATGKWSSEPNCEIMYSSAYSSTYMYWPMTCPHLTIENGNGCPETETPDECNVVCYNDTILDGEATIRCNRDGNWSRIPSCLPNRCPSLTIENGNGCPETETPYECSVVCYNDTILDGEATIRCNRDGNWSRIPSCLPNWCVPLTIENGNGCPKTVTPDECSVVCYNDTILDGEATIRCNRDGNWSRIPSCLPKPKRCPALQIPNAAKDPACSASYRDQECTVACRGNFDLDGEGKIKCDSSGKWSREPKCNLTEGTQSRGTIDQSLTKITNNFCNKCIQLNS